MNYGFIVMQLGWAGNRSFRRVYPPHSGTRTHIHTRGYMYVPSSILYYTQRPDRQKRPWILEVIQGKREHRPCVSVCSGIELAAV